MRGWKGACRNRLREERYHQLVWVRTGGGGTVGACTIPNSDSRLILLIRHAQEWIEKRVVDRTLQRMRLVAGI